MPCCKVRCKESRKRPELDKLDKLDVSKFHPKPQVDEYGYNDNDIILYVYIYMFIYIYSDCTTVCVYDMDVHDGFDPFPMDRLTVTF